MNRFNNLVLALSLVALSGCGDGDQAKEGEVKIKETGDKVVYEVAGKDGEKVTVAASEQGVSLPADFPKDVAIIQGATVKVAMAQGDQLIVHLSVPGAATSAAKFYEEALKAQGWAIETTMNMDGMSMVVAKKDNRQCSVTASAEGEGTLVQLAISQGQ